MSTFKISSFTFSYVFGKVLTKVLNDVREEHNGEPILYHWITASIDFHAEWLQKKAAGDEDDEIAWDHHVSLNIKYRPTVNDLSNEQLV